MQYEYYILHVKYYILYIHVNISYKLYINLHVYFILKTLNRNSGYKTRNTKTKYKYAVLWQFPVPEFSNS